MTDEATFGRILGSLHEAALDPARWPDFSAVAEEALGLHGTSLMFGDGELASGEDARIAFYWTCIHGERRLDLERLYISTYYPVDERTPRLRHAPDGRLLHNTEVLTPREMKTSPAYHALQEYADAGDAVTVRLDGPRGSRILWTLHDPIDRDGWTSARTDLIRRLLPHLRQAVRIQVALGGAGTLGMTLARLLETVGMGVIQLDRRARIVAANGPALGQLQSGNALFDADGCLFARTPAANAELQELLVRALPPFGTPAAGGSMAARRPAGAPLVLHVVPVGGGETHPGPWPVAALVLVPDAVAADVDASAVAETLGFTRAESQVAVLLAGGMTVREVAAATSRGESTVRSHVKHMLAKQGLTRQPELVRLVRSVAAAPALGPDGPGASGA